MSTINSKLDGAKVLQGDETVPMSNPASDDFSVTTSQIKTYSVDEVTVLHMATVSALLSVTKQGMLVKFDAAGAIANEAELGPGLYYRDTDDIWAKII